MQTDHTETTLTPEQTQLLESQVWNLRVQGYYQQRIAEQLGLDESTVSRLLKSVRARLVAEFTREALELRLEQTEQLLFIASEAMQAWKASKPAPAPTPFPAPSAPIALAPTQEQATAQNAETPAVAPASSATETVEAEQTPPPSRPAGHSAYLRIALQAYTAIRAIWGMEPSRKANAEPAIPYDPEYPDIDIERFKNQHLYPNDIPGQEPAQV